MVYGAYWWLPADREFQLKVTKMSCKEHESYDSHLQNGEAD